MWSCTYKTLLLEETNLEKRAQTETQGDITVTTTVLNKKESKKLFGINLAKEGIQPVWIKFDNQSDEGYFFFPISIDPDYYAATEVYYMNRYTLARWKNKHLEDHIEKSQMPFHIPAKSVVSGYVFTNLDQGSKFVSVQLVSRGKEEKFNFLIPVDDLHVDFHKVDFDTLYTENQFQNFKDEESLRLALEKIKGRTSNKTDDKLGDPINFVLIGDPKDVFPPFIMRGWDETEYIYEGSIFLTVRAFLRGIKYRYSPISPLYYFGRRQDLALQKARKTINERNHLRVWLSPYKYKGKNVWIGQISRDIGVRFTTKAWNLTTHKIDPNIDEARAYLLQDLVASQGVDKIGLIKGENFDQFTKKSPGHNTTGDPFYTDGYYLVFDFSRKPTSLESVKFFPWARKYKDTGPKKISDAKY